MTGIRETPTALQAYVRVNGRIYSQCFPKGTNLKLLKEWREDKRVAIRTGATIATVDPTETTFAEDARAYLKLVTSMPTYDDRVQQIGVWIAHFSRRPRSTITGPMIKAKLEALIAAGATFGTANRYRTALMSLWTTLDGLSARNPVRDVPRYYEGEGEIRALSHGLIYRILAQLQPSNTRTRLRVMAWTGWPPQQLRQLKPEHLQLTKARAFVTPRRKGKGAPGRWVPLLEPAVTALTAFDAENCYGDFLSSVMNSAFQLGVRKLNAHRARQKKRPIAATAYDLRHSFGVLVAALYKDDAVVQFLMCHSKVEQTQRYIRAARAYRLDAAATSATSDGLSRVIVGLRGIGETGKSSMKRAGSIGDR